jgi:tetratricopeptide (TPR) repeat protein
MNEETLFHEALAKAPAERAAFLAAACVGQPELRAAVEALLAAHAASVLLLDRPGVDANITGAYTPPLLGATGVHVPHDAHPGYVIAGRYTLEQKLGEGGMGEVWGAKQTEPVKRKVALKLIKAGMDSKAVIQRFEQERQALALMDHPHIAKVFDGGLTASRHPFFVMELVNGLPLNKFCDEAKLTPQERLKLFVPICQAVQHAHQKGIIHRDLKPGNILVTIIDGKPIPKVIDFGVAKATAGKLTEESLSTEFGAVVGTLEYMAPEQAGYSGLDVDTRADIYSLGVILYEILTGLRPLDSKRLQQAALTEMIRILKEEEPSKPSTRLSTEKSLPSLAAVRQTEPKKLMAMLRGELDWVVMKCLEKQRDRRYETANGLARDIQRYLASEPVEARPASFGYQAGKFLRRHQGPVIAASLVLLALLGGIVGTSLGLVEAQRAAEAERRAKLEAQAAAQAEKAAKDAAQQNLAYARKGNDVLGAVFTGLDPKANYATVAEFRSALKKNLQKAVAELDGSTIAAPLEVAQMQDTLGRSLHGLGEAALAVEVLVKARNTRLAQLGPDHPDTLTITNNLAAAYQAAGKLDQALPLYEETLKFMQAQWGPDDPHTLTSMNNLAAAYQAAGRFQQALPLFLETVRLLKAKRGHDHPVTINCMNNLAQAYQAAGQLDQALPLFEETLQIAKVRLGPDHPDTLINMGNLAAGYRAAGRFDQALPLFEETLKLMKHKLGVTHPDTLTSMNNLAECYQAAGRIAQALPLFEETLKLRLAQMGADHPDTLVSMGNLGKAYCDAHQGDKAVAVYTALISGRRKLAPAHEPPFRQPARQRGAGLAAVRPIWHRRRDAP